jgi:hypothetical protein
MDFSRAQTPGRGESAIVTTTYATYAHKKFIFQNTQLCLLNIHPDPFVFVRIRTSRVQTPGRGESAIVTTTYATCAHLKILILLRTPISIYPTCTLEYSQCGVKSLIKVCISLPPFRLADPDSDGIRTELCGKIRFFCG